MLRSTALNSFLALCLVSLPGCLAIGNGSGNGPTMADEIRELEELRDEGRITHEQYYAGVNKLLYQAPQ